MVLENVTVTNGLEGSPDSSRAYYTDTPTHRIAVFDYDREAGLTGRRPFAEVPAEIGRPDGLTVDEQGGVRVALSGGGAVRRYTTDGVRGGRGAREEVTECTFGGPRLDQMFITTSREGVEPGVYPLAGSLFRVVVVAGAGFYFVRGSRRGT